MNLLLNIGKEIDRFIVSMIPHTRAGASRYTYQGGDKPGPYPATQRLAKPDRVGAGLVPALAPWRLPGLPRAFRAASAHAHRRCAYRPRSRNPIHSGATGRVSAPFRDYAPGRSAGRIAWVAVRVLCPGNGRAARPGRYALARRAVRVPSAGMVRRRRANSARPGLTVR